MKAGSSDASGFFDFVDLVGFVGVPGFLVVDAAFLAGSFATGFCVAFFAIDIFVTGLFGAGFFTCFFTRFAVFFVAVFEIVGGISQVFTSTGLGCESAGPQGQQTPNTRRRGLLIASLAGQ